MSSTDLGINITNDLAYWLAFNERKHLFPSHIVTKTLENLSSIEDLWSAKDQILIDNSFSTNAIQELKKMRLNHVKDHYKELLASLKSDKTRIIKLIDDEYPPQLRNIGGVLGSPILIFHKGSLMNFNNCVAIVGTRNCSLRGRIIARKLSKTLANKGFTIVSGLARGVDAEVHCGALETKKGKTIAVLAWMKPIYPAEHSELIQDIEKRGARISENYFDSFKGRTPRMFVERNRIISGLSKFVIVIETDSEGGTMRLVEFAAKQRKSIFVLTPKENEKAYHGFMKILNKYDGIEFKSVDELIKIIQKKNSFSHKKLHDFELDPQQRFK
jgi:DNA processing protein